MWYTVEEQSEQSAKAGSSEALTERAALHDRAVHVDGDKRPGAVGSIGGGFNRDLDDDLLVFLVSENRPRSQEKTYLIASRARAWSDGNIVGARRVVHDRSISGPRDRRRDEGDKSENVADTHVGCLGCYFALRIDGLYVRSL